MTTLSRFTTLFMMLVFIVGCDTAKPTSNLTGIPSQSTSDVDDIEDLPTSTKTARPSFTPQPSRTPDLTQTVISQAIAGTESAEQTLMAPFSRVCKEDYTLGTFSPNGLWMVEHCYSENDHSPILTFSNKSTGILWKIAYRDYIQKGDFLPDGGLSVVHWSNDDRYAYFNSYVSGSGGECFVSGNVLNYGKGLFRLDLQTGITTTILPLRENFIGYDYSFSPTGRRMVYENNIGNLNILDLNSGEILNVTPARESRAGGGYLWSADGLRLVYSTVFYSETSELIAYSLRLVDSQSGSERILLESPNNCFVAKTWAENNVLTVESYNQNYDRTIIEYDLNANIVLSESTATPHP